MSWLTTDALPVVSGWGGPPKLESPNIGYLVSAILDNRFKQQQATQKSIADTIKELQTQRQTSAYTDALRNAGLTSGQDISGLNQQQATGLAQLIQEQTPDTDEDKLKQAMAAHYGAATNKENTIADYIKQYGRTPGARGGATPDDTPQTYTDDYGREWRLGAGGHWFLVPKNQSKQAMDAQANAAPSLDEQLITPDQPTPPAANPDVTITPTPPPSTSGAPPSDTGAGQVAKGYGVQATYMKAPDGTISPVDPNLVEYYKSKGAVVVPGP